MPESLSFDSDPVTANVQTVEQDTARQVANDRRGQLSIYTCPECGGSLWQVDTPALVQFRCHVGHVLSGEDLLQDQAQALEASLWRAVRLLEDHRNLARQMGREARDRGLSDLADRLEGLARRTEPQSRSLQQIIEAGEYPAVGRPSSSQD